MKIIKYTKQKGNTYRVDLENESIILYDDILIKEELLLKKQLSEKELEKIKKENENLNAYYKVLKYLNKKMRTEKEVIEFLKRENIEEEKKEEILKKLKKEKYVNEEMYLEAYINDKIKFTKDGPEKIKDNLKKLGLKEEEINLKLESIESQIWYEKIEKIIAKKMLQNKTDSEYRLKNKIKIYLLTNGYPKEMVTELLEKVKQTKGIEIIKKEKAKLENKLKRKYSDTTLIYQVKNRLLLKGFTLEEIKEVYKEK